MMLQFTDGRPFATGACWYRDHFVLKSRRTPRLIISISIGGFQTQAVVDTGGVYLVCDPEIADLLGLSPVTSLGYDTLIIRGYKYEGWLQRMPIEILANQGESLQLDVTTFFPALAPGQTWLFPSFLGLQGCLEFFRFAVDPGENAFYFGAF
jgi:hypothetical protein